MASPVVSLTCASRFHGINGTFSITGFVFIPGEKEAQVDSFIT
ncbi:MAG: hypothetical protein WDN26_05335 [Chitinophagaceae bacterium]